MQCKVTGHMGHMGRAVGTTILTGRTVEGGVRLPVTLSLPWQDMPRPYKLG